MRLKYQLRGLGIGIILGALLMGIFAGTQEESLTDAQIKERARALGMEESIVLSELPDKQSEEAKSEEPTATEEPTSTEEPTATEEPTSTEQATLIEESTPTEQISSTVDAISTEESASREELSIEKMVVITISGGDGSGTVSRKLKEAGLITNEQEYDKYLCNNGYDKKIRTGNHTIPIGASKEEIAKYISSK